MRRICHVGSLRLRMGSYKFGGHGKTQNAKAILRQMRKAVETSNMTSIAIRSEMIAVRAMKIIWTTKNAIAYPRPRQKDIVKLK